MNIANFPQPGPGWDPANSNIFGTTSARVPQSSSWAPNFNGASNTARNKTNQRGVLQFVAIHQTVDGEKLWLEHFGQPTFRIIDPDDSAHLNFLLMRDEMVEKAFSSLAAQTVTYQEVDDFYMEGPVNNLRHGSYPYGRYQTVPQVNYTLAKAQIDEGLMMSYSDVWQRIRPSGVPHTTPTAQQYADGQAGDVRAVTIGGPVTITNVFGKKIEIGWQWGVLIKPVRVTEGKKFSYRVTADGKIRHFTVKPCMKDDTQNQACARGYIWQLEFYCCPGEPELKEYSLQTQTFTADKKDVFITGGFYRLGKINYEFDDIRNFFNYDSLLSSQETNYSTDMRMCGAAPKVNVFYDDSAQKFF